MSVKVWNAGDFAVSPSGIVRIDTTGALSWFVSDVEFGESGIAYLGPQRILGSNERLHEMTNPETIIACRILELESPLSLATTREVVIQKQREALQLAMNALRAARNAAERAVFERDYLSNVSTPIGGGCICDECPEFVSCKTDTAAAEFLNVVERIAPLIAQISSGAQIEIIKATERLITAERREAAK